MFRASRVLAFLLLALPAAVGAQSDILLQLRSGSPLGDRYRVDSSGGMVAMGSLGLGIIPMTGKGERMMWYPYKASFRAGSIGTGGTMWDDANNGFYSMAGGYNTTASSLYTFAMGNGTRATNNGAVAMGNDTEASGQYSIALGERTVAASRGSIAVGANCSPVATCSSAWAGLSFRAAPNSNGSNVAMGQYVTADADWAVALGYRASVAGHPGSFVFGGSLPGASAATDSIRATADGQGTFRVPGGFRIFTNTAATVGIQVTAGGSSWNVISDRGAKRNFLDVDGEDLLARLRTVPVTTWRYKEEADTTVRHMGPMAQDWHAAFGFSKDDKTVNMSDIDGVSLAGIKALDTRTLQLKAELTAAKAKLEERDSLIASLLARVEELERRSKASTPKR
jgi:hypothetical protein